MQQSNGDESKQKTGRDPNSIGRLSLILGFFATYAMMFAFQRYWIENNLNGIFELGDLDDHVMPIIATLGTFLGVVSKSFYLYLNNRRTSLYRGALSAMLVSPIVIMYSYNAISTLTGNLFVAFLMAYQNGFFFRIVMNAIENGVRRSN